MHRNSINLLPSRFFTITKMRSGIYCRVRNFVKRKESIYEETYTSKKGTNTYYSSFMQIHSKTQKCLAVPTIKRVLQFEITAFVFSFSSNEKKKVVIFHPKAVIRSLLLYNVREKRVEKCLTNDPSISLL